jgi:hypothetical protein
MSDTPPTKTVYQRFNGLMAELEPIQKDREDQRGTAYRGIDDIYNVIKALMAKHGIFSLPFVVSLQTEERRTEKDKPTIHRILTVDYHFYGVDGDELKRPARVVVEARDSGDKGCAKAMAYADKVAIIQAFKIPVGEDSKGGRGKQGSKSAGGRDTGVVNKYRLDKAKGKPLTDGALEYLEAYGRKVARLLDEGKPYVSREHLAAIDRELETRRRRAAADEKKNGEPCDHFGGADGDGFCNDCGEQLERGN